MVKPVAKKQATKETKVVKKEKVVRVAKKVVKPALKKGGAKDGQKGKAEKGKKEVGNDFTWVIKKLQDKDLFFSLDHAVNLLTSVFNYLIDNNHATLKQVEEFISETNHSVTLEQIFKFFQLKQK